LFTVDSEVGGSARVAEVVDGGSAAAAGIRPGDRILTLGGTEVSGSAQVQTILGIASMNAPLEIEWSSGAADARKARLRGVSTPLLPAVTQDPFQRAVRAAWAIVDSICDVERAPIALANLAMLLSASGRHEASADVWSRVALPERAGIGSGTVQYYLGQELQVQGRLTEAGVAYRAAAASSATAFDDGGPEIAPAARDRLADLGIGSEANAP
jgi:membrane-associated protease RseP (regulator of RpoE activity)